MNKQLHKALLAILGAAPLAGMSTDALATGTTDISNIVGNPDGLNQNAPVYVWDGGNIGYDGTVGKGDCATNGCGNLPEPGRGRVGGASPMSGSVQDDRNMGWNHTSAWKVFEIKTAGGYTISLDRASTNNDTNNQPAFSVWTSGANQYLNENNSHKYNQVIAPISVSPDQLNEGGGHTDNGNDYMLQDDGGENAVGFVTGFVGYANSGATYVNAGGNTVLGALAQGTSVEGPLKNPALPYSASNLYTSIITKGAYTNPNAGAITTPYAGGGSSVETGDPGKPNAQGGGHAALNVWLPAGWYVLVGGGSCADFTCTATGLPTSTQYTYRILPNASVTAPGTPTPPPSSKPKLSVNTAGDGTGKVTSSPAGIDCGTVCDAQFDKGSSVKLTAVPDTGSKLDKWSGCTPAGNECTVSMDKDKSVTAQFAKGAAPPPAGKFSLTVTKSGNGKISSDPAGIDCNADCNEDYAAGTLVTLTATPDEGHQFSGWSGACSGTEPCTVTLSEARNVTATFTAVGGAGPFELTVKISGSGSVTSSPAGIDCGSACRAPFDSAVPVTLTARPNLGWRFAGWSGACGASETCTLSLTAAKTITARFARPPLRDFDGDGRADLLWRSPKTGRNTLWLMTGRTLKASVTLPGKDKRWSIAAVTDFDGDQHADVLWHHRATGRNHLWLINGGAIKSIVTLPDQAAAFSELRVADFDRDGKPDILWHNPATGEASLSLMDGAALKGTVALPAAPAGSTLAEVADFNGDDNPDVWWHDAATGQNSLWLMAATVVQSTATPPAQSAGWTVAGSGLFDDDNKADLLWRNAATGENQLWRMDGGNRSSSVDLPKMARAWYPAGVDDFDGKGRADILWRNRKNGKNRLWMMNGAGKLKKAPVTAFSKGWITPAH